MIPKNPKYFNWVAAILASLIWHALVWAKFPPPQPTPLPTQKAQRTRLVYIPANITGEAESNANALMTPVLFSLPSAQGFSKPLLQYRESILPGNYTHEEDVALLARSVAPNAEAYLSWPRHMDGQVAHLLNKPILWRQRATLIRDSSSPIATAIHIIPEGNLMDAEFSAMEFSINPEIKDLPRFWRADAHIGFSESGMPDRVFLEEPTEHPELNSEIIRNLHLWRIEKPLTPISGRIILQYAE